MRPDWGAKISLGGPSSTQKLPTESLTATPAVAVADDTPTHRRSCLFVPPLRYGAPRSNGFGDDRRHETVDADTLTLRLSRELGVESPGQALAPLSGLDAGLAPTLQGCAWRYRTGRWNRASSKTKNAAEQEPGGAIKHVFDRFRL
jgi:hypothetical protein